MPHRRTSLRGFSAKAKGDELAAANSSAGTDRIVRLNASLLDSSGLQDSLTIDAGDLEALSESLPTAGQKVPVKAYPLKSGTHTIW